MAAAGTTATLQAQYIDKLFVPLGHPGITDGTGLLRSSKDLQERIVATRLALTERWT